MPYYRAYFKTIAEANAAQLQAIPNIRAAYQETAQNDPEVQSNNVTLQDYPTHRFEVTAIEALPAGAAPQGVSLYRVTMLVTTADGVPSTSTITVNGYPTVVDPISHLTIDMPIGWVEYHAVGAPLDWRTRVDLAGDGRWLVELYTYPLGS